jgi:hypothetical protein
MQIEQIIARYWMPVILGAAASAVSAIIVGSTLFFII